jgi:hypothetical protein
LVNYQHPAEKLGIGPANIHQPGTSWDPKNTPLNTFGWFFSNSFADVPLSLWGHIVEQVSLQYVFFTSSCFLQEHEQLEIRFIYYYSPAFWSKRSTTSFFNFYQLPIETSKDIEGILSFSSSLSVVLSTFLSFPFQEMARWQHWVHNT